MWGTSNDDTHSWRNLSGLQLLVWPVAIVFLVQVLLAGGFEPLRGGFSLGRILGVGAIKLEALWSTGALGSKGIVQNGEWWRILCPIFLHVSVVHVFMNLWCLVSLGRLAQQLYTRSGLIFVFIVTGVSGVLFSFAWALYEGGGPLTVGASGAVCGFLGLLLSHLRTRSDAAAQWYARQLRNWAFFLAVWSFLPGISLSGHLGGFVAGYALGKVLPTGHFAHLRSQGRRRMMPLVTGGLALLSLAALIVGGVGAKERMTEIQSAEKFRSSLQFAYDRVNNKKLKLGGVETAIRANSVPHELETAKAEALQLLLDSPPNTISRGRLRQIRSDVGLWCVKKAPDLYRFTGSTGK